MGSVKDLTISKPAYENQPGVGNFIFSDRYSVFDWGEMPDQIVKKGAALAVMAAYNFEQLEKRGIVTHYRGLVAPDGNLKKFSDLKEGSNGLTAMQVSLAVRYDPVARQFWDEEKRKPKIVYGYGFFEKRGCIDNYLIPLEIIFRNGLPLGSSVFKKIAKAKKIENPQEREKNLQEIYLSLGLTSEPSPGQMLPRPIISYTTKLEPGDRNLDVSEARYISGLKLEQFREVSRLALKVNDFITEQTEKARMIHYDGKVEMVYKNWELVIVDVVGTFDENRLGFNGEQVSKEFLRQWYKNNQPEFAPACDEWKETGEGWQQRCPVKPINLPIELSTLVSQMYIAGCNQYVGKRIFDTPELETVMEDIRPFR